MTTCSHILGATVKPGGPHWNGMDQSATRSGTGSIDLVQRDSGRDVITMLSLPLAS